MPHDLRVIIAARLFYQKALHRLTYELARKGIIYHVICTPYFADFADYNLEGSENIVLHMSGSYGRTLSSRLSFNFFAAKNIRRLTKMKEADVIHAEGEGASSLLNAGAPMITSVNQALPSMEIWRNKGSGLSVFRSSAYSLFEVSQLFLSDLITFESESCFELYHPLLNRLHISTTKTAIIPLGIPLDRFRPISSDVRFRLGLNGFPVILAVPGSLSIRKGVHTVLESIPKVLKIYPHAQFLIVGDLKGDQPIIDLVNWVHSKCPEQLIMLSNLSRDELVRIYNSCDIFVHPSLFESSANVVLEAMACAKPVVITDTGLYKELESNRFGGKVISREDSSALAESIVELMNRGESARKKMGEVNHRLVQEKFSLDLWAKRMIKIYSSLLRN